MSRSALRIDQAPGPGPPRISFDLDDTLICYRAGVPREPEPPWYRRLFSRTEPLRLGARSLIRALQETGWEVWIYTTSHRGPRSIRRWLRSHGVRVAGVINQDTHERLSRRLPSGRSPSKNPAAFGISLHVDDSDGVRQEGERHGFRVVVVAPGDDRWTHHVLDEADRLRGELGEPDPGGATATRPRFPRRR